MAGLCPQHSGHRYLATKGWSFSITRPPRQGVVVLAGFLSLFWPETGHQLGRNSSLNRPTNSRSHTRLRHPNTSRDLVGPDTPSASSTIRARCARPDAHDGVQRVNSARSSAGISEQHSTAYAMILGFQAISFARHQRGAPSARPIGPPARRGERTRAATLIPLECAVAQGSAAPR